MCREHDVILYYYEELANPEEFLRHLESCSCCREFFESLQQASETFQRFETDSVPETLSLKIQSAGARLLDRRGTRKYALCAAMLLAVIVVWQIIVVIFYKTIESDKSLAEIPNWQTDFAQEIAALKSEIASIPEKSHSSDDNIWNMLNSIAILEWQIKDFKADMNRIRQESYLEHSLCSLKAKIGELDNQIEPMNEKETKYE